MQLPSYALQGYHPQGALAPEGHQAYSGPGGQCRHQDQEEHCHCHLQVLGAEVMQVGKDREGLASKLAHIQVVWRPSTVKVSSTISRLVTLRTSP